MARARFIENKELPFHITARCINREWFGLELPWVWSVFEEYLYFLANSYGIKIHSFVMMANHWHLIARSPNENLSSAMAYFMRETSRRIVKKSNRINQTYGSRFHRCLLGSELYYLHAYKYVYRNPVEAGLVSRVEKYPFSTLSGVLGLSRLVIPVCHDDTLFNDVSGTLEWLNRSTKKGDREVVKTGLAKPAFDVFKKVGGYRRHALRREMY